ncbi:hypothetical protein NF556_06530 [Ornithinimicrobium faecis]|uniref:DNA-binding protein n=1 Tax=Ornithinimicrobium faecis TaxID=2934158 RepID=A0ABY4YYV0_9MICO|nr:hypothetical protein [Ornithinimicrobium sp. HY1793]USQ81297.1 hypothetical protein NF556_06530 [Ornithinimicrobium sp. HY1793]
MDHTSGRHVPDAQEVARQTLVGAGARNLPTMPWQHPKEPADDVLLLRFALWRANQQVGSASAHELAAALTLIDAARASVDTLETALLFTARAEGWTWPQVAEALGVRTPQAAQQRYQRVSQRPEGLTR